MKTEKTTVRKKSPTKSSTATAKSAVPASAAPAASVFEAIPERISTMQVMAPEAPTAKAIATPTASQCEITSDLIAARAYVIWEEQGRPHGHDLANWLLAESQLKQEQSFTA